MDTRINNADEKSSFDSDSGTELRNLAENVGSIEGEISDEVQGHQKYQFQ